MLRILSRICLVLAVVFTFVLSVSAQQPDTTNPTSVDPNLITWQNATRPKEYTISAIKTSGVYYLDTGIVIYFRLAGRK